MRYIDPSSRTLDELWEAVDGACRWYSQYLCFVGLTANITGKGGWNASTWAWTDADMADKYGVGWGRTPRAAMMDMLNQIEEAKVSIPLHRWMWQENGLA